MSRRADYLESLSGQYHWTRELLSWWHPLDGSRGFDLLVTPVLAGPPPRIGELVGKQGVHRVRALLQFTSQFNVSGQPAISLPLHWTPDGLPVGVQLVAAYGREDAARAGRRPAGVGGAVVRSPPAAGHRGRSRRA